MKRKKEDGTRGEERSANRQSLERMVELKGLLETIERNWVDYHVSPTDEGYLQLMHLSDRWKMIDPENHRPYSFQGALNIRSRPDLAVMNYEAALLFAPDDSRVWYGLGRAYSQLRNDEKAITCYQEALRREKNAEFYHGLSEADIRKERYADALPIVNKAISLQDDPCIRLTKAIINDKLGNQVEAIRDLTSVIEDSPQHAFAHLYLSHVKEKIGIDGDDDLKVALALDDDLSVKLFSSQRDKESYKN